ncbi:MAG TPA: DedA family protein, partial [Ktedonobacterales bacterium]|nr:DedA family protein [Ktedonobacterales bacterium]
MLEHLLDLLRDLYDQYGYLIVFLGAFGENTALLGLALPGGTLALLGAFYARQGTLNLVWVIFFAWMGTVLGYHVDYLLGRFALGKIMLRWGDSRLGRRMRLAGRLRLGRRLLTKYGGRAILLSHIVGHIRSFVALSAGATRMSYRRFLSFELVAALLWNTAFCLIGYLAGAEYD